MRMLFTLTGYVLAGYCLLCLLLYLLQRQLIYFPLPAQLLVAVALALFDQLQSKHSDITVLGRSLGNWRHSVR